MPYSKTVRAVEVTWAGENDERRVEVISGGYLDEVVEAFDDLREVEGHQVGMRAMTVLAGRFLGRSVQVASWLEPAEVAPCETHGVVAVGLSEGELRWLLDGVGTKSANESGSG